MSDGLCSPVKIGHPFGGSHERLIRLLIITRNGIDWSERLPAVVAAVSLLEVKSCLIDGEAVVCNERGLAVVSLLRRDGRIKHEAHLIAFDLRDRPGRQSCWALAGVNQPGSSVRSV
jgi:hypothetical protein